MERRLPLVAIWDAWRADQVLYGSCILGIYNDAAVLSKILSFGGKARSKNSLQYCYRGLSSFVCYFECFSDPNTLMFSWFRTSPKQHKLCKGLHIGLLCILHMARHTIDTK